MYKYFLTAIFLIAGIAFLNAQKVYTTYLWHLQQPIYWPEKSQANSNDYQFVKESNDIKFSGGNDYGTGTSHPTNNLEEIFGKQDRVNIYQHRAKETVQSISSYADAGVQVNYSGCLIENVNSLADANQWGYYPGWEGNFQTAREWTTSDGYPRMDIVGFTYHHALSPLISERAFRKELQAHKVIYGNTFGNNPVYTKGYFPAECCFTVRNIKVLKEEGFEWSVVANSHLARTLSDYPLSYGTNGCNIDPPNKADKVSTTGDNWFDGQIDGRGGTFAAPYCYQAHKAQYIDPETGTEHLLTVVPMADLLSYRDGYSEQGTGEIETNILPYSNESHPSIVLLCHDGDNAWGGGASYYQGAVPNFTGAVNAHSEMSPSTIQQFLHDNPVPADNVVHVEDGGWVNASNDWGHPQFINWLWPLYNPTTYEFNPDGWTEDARNWAVITAIDNYACMAEDLDGNVDINKVVYPDGSSSNAEKAWRFYMPALTSGYMYYGTAEDMEVKQTIAGNNAIEFAQLEIDANPGVDNTPPSVFIPQRYPYNPGAAGFGPTYGYQEHINSKDFTVWTYGYDVNGIETAKLKYRVDTGDEINSLDDTENDTYTGGSSVSEWYSLPMTKKTVDPAYDGDNPEVDFFVLPDAIADLYYAEITELSDTLVDYYVEMTDANGNTFKTPIQHVWVGDQEGGGGNANVYWEPQEPTMNDYITIYSGLTGMSSSSMLHWGIDDNGSWTAPIEAYQPPGTVPFSAEAVQTPFSDDDGDGIYTCVIGPFNDPAQVAEQINFVIKVSDSNWDNNGGSNYNITINNNPSDNPVSANNSVSILVNETYNFQASDFTFSSSSGGNFAAIQLQSLETAGDLEYNGTDVTTGTDYPDPTLLSFTPAADASGAPYATFSFKVKDDNGLYSEADYTFTINVFDENPLGADGSVSMLMNSSYTFDENDFSFTGTGSATFAGIRIESVETAGDLEYNGTDITASTDYEDMNLLVFTPDADQSGQPYADFTFKVKDSEGRYSNDIYSMTINVIGDIPDGVSWFPENPTSNDLIKVYVKNDPDMSATARLHWGVNGWTSPNAAYEPANTISSDGMFQTLFTDEGNGLYSVELGPFNNEAQVVNSVDFVLKYSESNWNNNGGNDWEITVTQAQNLENISKAEIKIFPNPIREKAIISVEADNAKRYIVYLTNMNGNLIKALRIGSSERIVFSRGNLKAGIYILNFYDEISKTTQTKKIIIL